MCLVGGALWIYIIFFVFDRGSAYGFILISDVFGRGRPMDLQYFFMFLIGVPDGFILISDVCGRGPPMDLY